MSPSPPLPRLLRLPRCSRGIGGADVSSRFREPPALGTLNPTIRPKKLLLDDDGAVVAVFVIVDAEDEAGGGGGGGEALTRAAYSPPPLP